MIKVEEILKLSTEEKISIVEAIWNSIETDPKAIQIPVWQIEEINRRLDNIEAGTEKTYTWEEVISYAKAGL